MFAIFLYRLVPYCLTLDDNVTKYNSEKIPSKIILKLNGMKVGLEIVWTGFKSRSKQSIK